MKNVVFRTEGTWETTTLFVDGQEYPASQLYVELHAGQGYNGPGRGGIGAGGDITAVLHPQDNPDSEDGIFPGRLEMNFPGHVLMIENTHPTFAFEFTRVGYNHRDVTDHVVEILVNIDAVDNVVQASITLYKAHWLSADEVATYTIL